MREGSAQLIRREDYAAPAFWIKTVDLTFDLDPAKTLVINKMAVEPNPAQPGAPLRLDGEDINLTRVLVDGEPVSFRTEGGQLVLENLPQQPFHAGDPQHLRAREEHAAVGPVHQQRRLLHAVRGPGFPPHHLLP